MKQRVVCSANRLSDGTIILGVRHWDEFMHQQMNAILGLSTSGDKDEEISMIRGHEQGFVDQFGAFLTRKEALEIAKENGQIIRDLGYDPGELYSEHLY